MPFCINTHQSIASIDENDWNACALPLKDPYQPFVDHRFLLALEESGCVSEETGWSPNHLELKHNDETVGLVPMYLKGHSRGEYVFDYAWAEALYRVGGHYYPKYQVCIPFTPVTGARILVKEVRVEQNIEASLIQEIIDLTDNMGLSSAHITFLNKSEWDKTKVAGLLQRMDLQFHWHNEGYDSFDDFVSQLTSKKRKNIRRERRDLKENDLHIEWLTGSDLLEHHWDAFYVFYLETSSRKWGNAYLNREFFSLVSNKMPERILLILCRRGSKYIAGALHFLGDETLYGRNWGCIEHYPFLHFELCYYQAMDFAIQHRLQSLEAGAQGAHKFTRGYTAQPTYSAHYIANKQFRAAVARFLAEERKFVHRDLDYLDSQTPFKEHTLSIPKDDEPKTVNDSQES